MAFNEQLPEWKNEGVKPPETKRTEGWLPGEKPPASWFNWLLNRAYETLKELQEKAETISNKGQAGGYASLDSEGRIPEGQLPEMQGMEQHGNEWHREEFETITGAASKATAAIENANTYTEQLVAGHTSEKIHLSEVHGIRVNKSTNRFEYFDDDWKEIFIDETKIRDNPELNLRFRVSDTPPPAIDGRVYYNTTDGLFYVARDGQWWRLFVAGDEKLEQDPPGVGPELDSRTDTTIKLVADSTLEYKYEGGDWQESSLFAGLSRNTEYTFYSRYKETEIYKASPPSPSAKFTTDKGTQTAPAAPTVSAIEWDRATVTGASGTEVRLVGGTWYDSPHTFTGLNEDTTYQAYARYKETATHYASPVSTAKSFNTPTKAPGPSTLIAGTMQEGFFGEVPSSQFITGDALASLVGISAGTSQHSTTPWMKHARDGKIQFSPLKPIRHGLSWKSVNAADCVYGNKVIEVQGLQFKIRLFRGALTDPSEYQNADRGAHGSEWNRLILPIHQEAIDKSWVYPAYVESDIPVWVHNLGTGAQGMYTDEDLLTHCDYGSGSYSWCQETRKDDTAYRVGRGYYGVSYSFSRTSSTTYGLYGWRPVLELIS